MTQSHPDFSGEWRLDLKASQLPELLLELQQVSWVERRAGKMMPITQIISQDEDSLHITISSPIANRTEQFVLNGEPQIKIGKRTGEVTTSSYWDGPIQVTCTQMNTPQGKAEVTSRRRLEADQHTMVVQVEVNAEDGRQETIERVFRRITAEK